MGLFSSSKSKVPKTIDKVWKTRAESLRGIATQALLALKSAEFPLLLTYFDESHKELVHFLDSSSVPYAQVNTFTGRDVLLGGKTLAVANAMDAPKLKEVIPREVIPHFLILGHYPLPSVEEKCLIELAGNFPAGKFTFCLSLEDPILELFGAAKIKGLMESLGVKNDECIDHPMVTKAIRGALLKLGERVTTETKAHSEREWFQLNVKA